MKGKILYQIFKEVQRGETAIINNSARPAEAAEHTKGFLECLFYLGEIGTEEQIAFEDCTEKLYTEIEIRRKEIQNAQ